MGRMGAAERSELEPRPDLQVVPDIGLAPPEPLPLEDGFFAPAKYHRIRGSVTRELGRLAELPEETFRLARDLGQIAWVETRRAKVETFTKNERRAIESVHAEHFAGFDRTFIPFESVHGHKYELAAMEWEGTKHPDHQMVWIPGWFGRYESFAEQAASPYLREFSHLMYNRPGTDRESSQIIREPNYTPVDHMTENILTLERLLDRSVEQGRDRFTLVGHSFGGILTQSFLDYAFDVRPDLYERVNAAVLTNTTRHENVVEGSFLDRLPGSPPVIRKGLEVLAGAMEQGTRLHRRIMRKEPLRVEIVDEEATSRILEGLKVVMTVGYFDTMIGGDAKRDVYLASKGRAKQNDGLAMIYDGLAMLRVPERTNLARTKKPIFVVTGGRDQLLPDTGHGVASQYVRAHGDRHHVREFFFDDSGHCTPMTVPEVFNSLVHRVADDPRRALKIGTRRQYRLKAIRAAD